MSLLATVRDEKRVEFGAWMRSMTAAHRSSAEAWLGSHERQILNATDKGGGTVELCVFGVIGYDFWTGGGITTESIQRELAAYPDAKRITALIDSPGGSVFDGIGIQAVFKRHAARVEIEVLGLAASAASVVAMGASNGGRISMHTGAVMMVHQASAITWGNADDHQKTMDALRTIDSSLIDVYEERTGRARKDVDKLVRAETWMSAREAVEEGFADRVVKAGAKPVPKLSPEPEDEPEDDGNPMPVPTNHPARAPARSPLAALANAATRGLERRAPRL